MLCRRSCSRPEAPLASLLDAIVQRLEAEEQKHALETGRGRHQRDKYDERIGFAKGLMRAAEIVKEEAKKVNEQED